MISYCVVILAVFAAFTAAFRPRLDGRIVGGQPGNIADFPYQVSLQLETRHICGGSIISDEWVLTAAHCVIRSTPSSYQIRAGSTYRSYGGYFFQVAEIVKNIDYNTKNHDMDFALFRIKGKFPLGTKGVSSAKLTKKEPSMGTECVVSGWGTMSSGGISPDELRYVNVHVVDRQKCNKDYVNYGGITNNMFCAADPAKDSCQGDSGGPLLCNGELSGVVSWGVGCASPNYPGVYSNIQNARGWIKDVANV